MAAIVRQSVQDLIIGRRDTYNIGSERMVRTPLATPNCAYVRSAVSTPGDRLRVSWLIACAIMAVIVATAGHWKHSVSVAIRKNWAAQEDRDTHSWPSDGCK